MSHLRWMGRGEIPESQQLEGLVCWDILPDCFRWNIDQHDWSSNDQPVWPSQRTEHLQQVTIWMTQKQKEKRRKWGALGLLRGGGNAGLRMWWKAIKPEPGNYKQNRTEGSILVTCRSQRKQRLLKEAWATPQPLQLWYHSASPVTL